eukprot:Filipodium_phascolosomae@DN3427_c0_g1_i1.p1
MYFYAWVVIPVALVELILLLSSVKFLQRIVFSITNISIQIGGLRLNINFTVMIMTAVMFFYEKWRLMNKLDLLSQADYSKYISLLLSWPQAADRQKNGPVES